MIQYILESIAFQLVFLIIYDFFLKRETFFQWNRAYLIGTYLISLFLPWIKIEAFQTDVPERFYTYPEYLWGANDAVVVSGAASSGFSISWEHGLLFGGMLLAALLFGYKMLQLYRLRRKGEIKSFKDFTRIVVSNSNVAFSFFRSIFLGDRIVEKEHEHIIEHELVHIQQRHTYDLLFFELMRIFGWFNPLVYVYQNRISELHEFIADAQVAKTGKEEQYELLLSQAFQTQNISFINQFFNSPLIKKRIVMLTKEKSLNIWKVKYLALVPMLIGILFYTSCDRDVSDDESEQQETITVGDIENLSLDEEKEVFTRLTEFSVQLQNWKLTLKDKNSIIEFSKPLREGSTISGPNGVPIKARMKIESSVLQDDFSLFDNHQDVLKLSIGGKNFNANVKDKDVPFSVVEEVPIFPGCEGASNTRACFQEKMQSHISKNFRYPEEAQKQSIQGRVSIMFTIDEQGNITNIRKRGPSPLLEDETVRIIEKLPQMKPGKQRGVAVRVPFSIPINFKLQQAGFNSSSKNQDGNTTTEKLHLNSNGPYPLVIIDGEETSKTELDEMNTERIKSVNVLKKEAALKKYGLKAKNGVIEIITKEGAVGDNSFRGNLQPIQIAGHNAPKEKADHSKADQNRIQVSGYTYDMAKNMVYGKITDGSMPLPGVNIAVQGSNYGVISDFDGAFAINAEKGDVITFQYIGLPTAKLSVTNSKS
ncbi:TonB family C-terminal domain-containing protein [Pricia antarctica]|uniref:TonB family C-terminal domain-containing protein n=1 Tax=Pricia antarctica TaxID=641691 RepID=A0A1G6Z3S0_9FLAO|nr:M56 family metallopeptidase [Pricia antarctica]SDD96456.1 TonB family C-terminal domain-containing protein [Pricia antarctica]